MRLTQTCFFSSLSLSLTFHQTGFLKGLSFSKGAYLFHDFTVFPCVFSAQISCENNLEFAYNMQACNRTCLSLSGPDPRCGVEDAPVEGCGCLEGTHLNKGLTCSPKAECSCSHQDSSIPPGPVVIDGLQWWVTVLHYLVFLIVLYIVFYYVRWLTRVRVRVSHLTQSVGWVVRASG